MRMDFEAFLRLNDEMCIYENEPVTNDEFAEALEICSLRAELDMPKELFEAIKKIDIKHFVIKLEDIIGKIATESGVSLDEIKSHKDIMDGLTAMPYSLTELAIALDLTEKHYTNPMVYDLFLYNLLDIKSDDDVCEIASLNGYLPALMGMKCNSVTMFNLEQELHGFPENNLKLAGYEKNNITIINDSCPYRNTLHSKVLKRKFSKIYSNMPMTFKQYAAAKKLLRPNGVLFSPVVSRKNEADLIYYNGEDNLIATLNQDLPTLEEELKFN